MKDGIGELLDDMEDEINSKIIHLENDDPHYQRNGVGNVLLKAMYSAMRQKGIKEFVLDSGYKTAQQIWTKKFGEPQYLLKDYWGKANDHMIWKVNIDDVADCNNTIRSIRAKESLRGPEDDC